MPNRTQHPAESTGQAVPPSVTFEKRIWFYWHQGLGNAPGVVQKCHRSWRVRNPNWELMNLSSSDLSRHLDHDAVSVLATRSRGVATAQSKISTPLSDLVRINLLRKYGGVWVDASCFCITPLDDWLSDYMGEGFFAFSNPGPDRLLSSWFLAADKESYITCRWADTANMYWSGPTAPNRLVGSRLAQWATALRHDLWFSKPVKEWLRIYPYFWFHYLFRYLYERDERFRAAWDAVPKFAADVPHAALYRGLDHPIDPAFRQEIDQRIAPLYKLNWRVDEKNIRKDSVLHYLYQTL